MPSVASLDHLVLTVVDIPATVAFYVDVLGMRVEEFQPADGSPRTALKFGRQKINLHPAERPFDPKAMHPLPGSADLCFLTDHTAEDWLDHLSQLSIPIEEGPVTRTGATDPILSIYVRDPDNNLIEIGTRV
ncbi:Virulence protein [Falsiruegeria litorea R37]|uniref:Virulence protein n=1 Tax=Falsiruegeria litorea R37 TaxID=1200284 RepID=A0A1Y5RE44_9RHOB|nr:VOC family protein [Falsiruegeria litorea]SLN15090.1 Virulence protein [Falsiruegeria litorea R37]